MPVKVQIPAPMRAHTNGQDTVNAKGTTVQEVNALLKQYAQARKMMKSITGGGGFLGKRLGKFKLPMGLGQ